MVINSNKNKTKKIRFFMEHKNATNTLIISTGESPNKRLGVQRMYLYNDHDDRLFIPGKDNEKQS